MEMREINPVLLGKGFDMGFVCGSNRTNEGIRRFCQFVWINELFGDFIEVVSRPFDGGPFRVPTFQEFTSGPITNNVFKIIEKE